MSGKPLEKNLGGWLFLALVLVVYGLFSLVSPEATAQALHFFTHVMGTLLPILGLVFLLLFIANLLLEPKRIKRYLGKESGIKGWVTVILGGILSMGPIYAWYTMLSELQKKGMRSALIAAFLYSRAVKPPLLPLMIYYFGLTYTLVLCMYLIGFAIISGILVEKLTKQRLG